MVEFLQVYLPITIYILLIILIIIGIILGVRLIKAMNHVDSILDDIDRKIGSLNGLFNVIDFTTDKIASFSDRVVELISGIVSKVGSLREARRRKKEEEYYE